MATIINKNYQAIDFSDLKETNIFGTTLTLMLYSYPLIDYVETTLGSTVIASVTVPYKDRDWIQTYSGNSKSATHTFTSGDYYIEYQGSGIVTGSEGVYKKITYALPFSATDSSVLKVTFEGAIERFTTGNTGDGTINKITYEFGDLKLELYGTITKTFDMTTNPASPFNKFSGTITGFNFQDENGQLSITGINPPLSLDTFDSLTFDQLDAVGEAQTAQTTNTSFADLFNELAKDIYTSGTDVVIVDPGTSGTVGGVGSATNPYVISEGIEELPLLEGSSDYYAVGNASNNVMTGNSVRNFFEGRAGNDTLSGNAGNDSLKGESGIDTLDGGEGNDTMDGGSEKDTLKGGNGDDGYVLDVTVNGKYEDKITEAKNAGNDTLYYRNTSLTAQSKAVTLKLVKNFENLDISQTGTMNFNLTGDANANALTGNDGNNVISGGKGADTMIGNAGNDTYVVDNAGDIVTEAVGEGTDTVQVKIGGSGSYTLSDNVENGALLNKGVFNLTGNASDNTLVGNAKANTLNGGDGNDTLNGGKGNDILSGGNGGDNLNGGKGNDIINGGAGNDTMTGGAGADTFVWTLADVGSAGSPTNDTITDFSVAKKDVLDLRDLIPSANEADINNVMTFMDVTFDGTNTLIHVSATGGFTGGVYDAAAENATITLANVNLLAGTDETNLLQNLINKNQLLID